MKSLKCLTNECLVLLNKHQLLLPLIKAEIIEQELTEVKLEPGLENKLQLEFWDQQKIEDEEGFAIWLNQNQIDRDTIIKKLTGPARLNSYCQKNFESRAERRFLERKKYFDQVVYSLIRVRDPFKARELYLQVAEQESDFGNLAAEFSEGREKISRGIIGPVPLIQAHPTLMELLRSSEPGEIREPIQIEGWYLVVRLESYQSAALDQAMEQRMSEELFGEWVEETAGSKMKQLLSEASLGEGIDTTKSYS